jgi:phage terminase large subunit-like protein
VARRKKHPVESASNYWFDEVEADRLVKFFPRHFKHVKGPMAGQPFVLADWQAERIIRPIFGWKRKSDNTRRYRRVYIEIPRKSGKSTLSAGLGIIGLTADRELGAEVYSAAADRDQAAIVFDVAKSMVEADPDLSRMIRPFRRSMTYEEKASSYKVLSADAPTKHGLNASMILFDELHAQPNRELWDVLTTSTGARTQPLIIAITTAGYDRHSICWEQHEYALKVRDGIIQDDSFLPVIYAAVETADWTDPKVWAKANPGLGKSITLEYLENEAKRAKEVPAYQNTFRRLHLNQWTEQETRWLDMAVWERNSVPVLASALEGRECFGGLDLASTTDIAAFSLVFPPKDVNDRWQTLWWFWVPEEGVAARSRKDRVPYDVWVREGWIEATEGNITDYDAIRPKIRALGELYNIREIAYDRWNATQLTTQLEGDGFTMVPFGQGFSSMAAPTKELLSLLIGDRVAHGNNPVAKWMASNVTVRTDPAGNQKPDKGKSTERIDGIVAEIMALGRAMVQPEVAEPSITFLKWG